VKRIPVIAAILSLIVPGLGQIYGGEAKKGATILAAAIVMGSLNIIILPLIAIANPVSPVGAPDARTIWAYWTPRLVHDLLSFWSIAFWAWAVFDAARVARRHYWSGR
jgi:TM2 domain-containing membrane protein YozV